MIVLSWVKKKLEVIRIYYCYFSDNKATTPAGRHETCIDKTDRIAEQLHSPRSALSPVSTHTTKPNQVSVISVRVQHQHWAPSAMNSSTEGSRHQSNHPLNTSRENSCHTMERFHRFDSVEGKHICYNIPTNTIIYFATNMFHHHMMQWNCLSLAPTGHNLLDW